MQAETRRGATLRWGLQITALRQWRNSHGIRLRSPIVTADHDSVTIWSAGFIRSFGSGGVTRRCRCCHPVPAAGADGLCKQGQHVRQWVVTGARALACLSMCFERNIHRIPSMQHLFCCLGKQWMWATRPLAHRDQHWTHGRSAGSAMARTRALAQPSSACNEGKGLHQAAIAGPSS